LENRRILSTVLPGSSFRLLSPPTSTPAAAMPLSWNEIRSRALAFSQEWAEVAAENAEAKSF
jgi:hypothetical protein